MKCEIETSNGIMFLKGIDHKQDDGSDNYLELVQNISRNFTNMRLFRDRVVNKEQCKTMQDNQLKKNNHDY